MEWTEVTITIPTAYTDAAADIAQMTVPYGLYIEDYSDLEEGAREIAHIDLIDEELLKKDRTRSIVHIYLSPEANPAEALAFLSERYTAEGIPHTLGTASIREEDWANNWKQYFKPLKTGERLLICPLWESVPDPQGRKVLRIDPGLAFGTGGHHTTRLCLTLLEKAVAPGCTLLDVGCGSGILSIAGLLLGASRAVGVDIDPLAVKTAAENGRLNGMQSPAFTVLAGDLVTQVQGTFSVVASNIVADAIISLAPSIGRHLAPGGVWITSGIIDAREPDVLAAFAENGFAVTGRMEEGGWLCFACRRAEETGRR